MTAKDAMIPSTTPARPLRRRSEGALFAPLLILLVGVSVLALTMPLSGSAIPGSRRVASLLKRVPLPWNPPRPQFVLAPEVDTTALPSSPGVAAPAQSEGAAAETGAESVPPEVEQMAAAVEPEVAVEPATVEPVLAPLPPVARLNGFRHQWQTWNNCGPATITMATSHFGRPETQVQAAAFLKPNPDDKNVGPDELVTYARSIGLHADWLVAGDLDRLRRLVVAGVPVVVEMWITPEPNDGMGHYRLLVGYDDLAQQFVFYDSLQQPGVNVRLSYGAFDADWRVFNRTYIPVYPAEKAGEVDAIIGTDRDEAQMWRRSLSVAQEATRLRPDDPYAWFNAGTSLTVLGRTAEAVQAFDRARGLRLPWRMLWYQFGPFESYLAEGRYADVLALTAANLQQTGDLEESHYYRGRALEAQGQVAQARASYRTAVRLNPRYAPAQHALSLLG